MISDKNFASGANIFLEKDLKNILPENAVIISGMSGVFPSSNNIDEFKENLYAKRDMVTKNPRYKNNIPDLPPDSGNIPRLDEYDAGNFGTHWRLANYSDPAYRLIFETVFESILDAGLNPADIEHTRTGLFLGLCFNESENWLSTRPEQQFTFYGILKSSIGTRLAYYLKIKGPVVILDTACSTSLHVIDMAYKEIMMGNCDQAIVVSSNIILRNGTTIQFKHLGLLGPRCNTFDEKGNGYVRSEAVASVILQRAQNAKRIYAQIINSKSNSDGYKEQGITYPSAEDQKQLLHDIYSESNISPNSLSYLEAHGTGTVAGDPVECSVIDNFFCKTRNSPLPIGSGKSNFGHAEPASGLCSLVKVLLAMECGLVAPNIHFSVPNPSITGIIEGRMRVITDPLEIKEENPVIGINSFGFGGSNAHVILKSLSKKGSGVPDDNLPRLVFVSGRSEDAVNYLLNDVSTRPLDVNHVRLLQSTFSNYIKSHNYRGYNIISKSGEVHRAVYTVHTLKVLPLHFLFGEFNYSETILKTFSFVPCFQDTLHLVDKFLTSKNLSISSTILNPKKEVREAFNILGGIIVQIGISNILKALKLSVDSVRGYSYGELIYVYHNNTLTLDEILNCALILSTKHKSGLTEQANEHNGHSKNTIPVDQKSSAVTKGSVNNLLTILATPKIAYAENDLDVEKEKSNESLKSDSLILAIGLNNLEETTKDLDNITILRIHNFQTFLESLGNLYFHGHLSEIVQLYPKVEFPVKRGTPMISSKIKWNHIRTWWVYDDNKAGSNKESSKCFFIDPNMNSWEYITGHVQDDRLVFPVAGYLYLVWITLRVESNLNSIIFEDCQFLREVTLNSDGVTLNVQINDSGRFECSESGFVVAKGKVTVKQDGNIQMIPLNICSGSSNVLSQRDVYKELRLRGYNYSGQFRAIQEAEIDVSRALIKFKNNWVAFLDNLFQLKILAQDTRNLYVPAFIDSVKINFIEHQTLANISSNNDNETVYEAFYYKYINSIRSGGVEIKGLHVTQNQRKKTVINPILESYVFIPNNTELSPQESIQINAQILMENTLLRKIKSVEIVDSETPDDPQLLSEMLVQFLQDQPLIHPDAKILTNLNLESKLAIESKNIGEQIDCALIIGSKLLNRAQMLVDATKALKSNGFIISRELLDFNPKIISQNNLIVITTHNTGKEVFVLLSKTKHKKTSTYIEISDDPECSWLTCVQDVILKESNDVVVYSQNNLTSGLLGFTNCLRKEPGYQHIRCVLILDQDKKFEPNSQIFGDQLEKNMTVNIYKDGQWGTFRYLLLNQNKEIVSEHYIVKELVRGDVSSFRWMQGPLRRYMIPAPEKILIDVYYAALNFKDVMTATININVDVAQDQVEGFEFSGIDQNGHRILGFNHGSLANMILTDKNLTYRIPDAWSLKEASSIFYVYVTVLTAFFDRGRLNKGESILIHSGTGGIGQAAIYVCSQYECNIFTTYSSAAKKELLLKKYPKLKESHIGNSRETSFEKMIMRETRGRGVDLVLNSLSDEKLMASIRCLARGGRFIDLGRYDSSNNNQLNMLLMEKEVSFHGVHLDGYLAESPPVRKHLMDLINNAVQDGLVSPLDVSTFRHNELEQAFRYMSNGENMEKVVVEIRPENAPPTQVRSIPRFYCNSEKSYVILGGLGGFGLELADWFVLRGARHLVLVNRSGVKTGYQKSRIDRWTRNYGLTVKISTANITTKEGCKRLIKEANEMAPVGGIFNLAVVLKDALVKNQTVDMFKISMGPKAYATKYLDEISRKSCPDLEYFVMFSSFTCGRGNAGQTNYGLANSVMERICECRRKDGLPGLAIQWGPIGEVGLLAEAQEEHVIEVLEYGGNLQQKLSNCLEVLNTLLRQETAAVVSSIVVAEKKNLDGSENMFGTIANILGLDLTTVQDTQTLSELGIDSMTAIEIKQILEREYGIFLNSNDIRRLTFARIKDLESEESYDEKYENK